MNEKEDFFKTRDDTPRRRSGRSRRRAGCFPFLSLAALLGFVCLALVLVAIDVTNSGGRIRRELIERLGGVAETPSPPEPEVVEKVVEKPVEKVVEVPVEPPMPSRYVPWKKVDTAELWSGIPVETRVRTERGKRAAIEREQEDSYRIDLAIHLDVPRPSDSAEALAKLNPSLPDMLKDFGTLVESAEVSSFYHHLYSLKTARIQQKATRMHRILTRHNFYDCETVLEATHPETGRKVLLAQGDMDVVADGSDGDRWPELDDYISMSSNYQPFTSYGWTKRTDRPNPLLARWETKLEEYEEEFAIEGLSIERNRFLRSRIEEYEKEIADMKARSYLIAEADPFMVLPLSFLGRGDETDFAPAIGDYAVVIHEDRLYPAIAGDAGPSWKFGEASLRIAQTINEDATPYSRPVSELEVTYLIFPGSAEEEKGPPDLEAWHAQCRELLDDLGGTGEDYDLHRWKDLVAARKRKREEAKAEAEAETTGDGDDEADDPHGEGGGRTGESGDGAGKDSTSEDGESPEGDEVGDSKGADETEAADDTETAGETEAADDTEAAGDEGGESTGDAADPESGGDGTSEGAAPGTSEDDSR